MTAALDDVNHGASPPIVNDGDWLRRPLPTLHKDFYFKHPAPSLQAAEFCWGNLEEAHPILGSRSQAEAEKYRLDHGILVDVMRGRAAPKPFQAFDETSFPEFIEKLAYELFTSEAKPLPVQAQAWPCALSGADVIAVAPTGSGKTWAFLLPGIVHIMAQPALVAGEGPIALILEPTRELAQQTEDVAKRICERTQGEDLLRAGAVYGGVAPTAPSKQAPDNGRWPEILVATPGRLLELLTRRCWMSAKRISYVVLDEADQLLSSSGQWLMQVQKILKRIRPDRQLLFFSATLPSDAEASAAKLCGGELVRIKVNPSMPDIPQDVRLFRGSFDGGHEEKLEELLRFIGQELRPEESLLLLCQNREKAKDMASCPKLAAALKAHAQANAGSPEPSVLLQNAESFEASHANYWSFVQGKAKALVSTFAISGRGLDFSDTTIATESRTTQLSLVVVLFDFPTNIMEYANSVGRTARPGQAAGRALVFLPEGRFWMIKELIAVLEQCKQRVPQSLRDQHEEDTRFLDDVRTGMVELATGEGTQLETRSLCGGVFDTEKQVWLLPASLPSYRRKLLHLLADEQDIFHVSSDTAEGRQLHLSRKRENLPDKVFVLGEQVVIDQPGRPCERGEVLVAHYRRRIRKIQVRIQNRNYITEIPIEDVWPVGHEPPERDSQAIPSGKRLHGYEKGGYELESSASDARTSIA